MSKKLKHITNKFPERNNPFKVPEGYFSAFPDQIMSKIDEQSSGSSKRTIIRYLKPVLAMAASFALIFMLVYVPVKTLGPGIAKNNEKHVIEQDFFPYLLTDEVIYRSFSAEEEKAIDDTVIETVLLASVSDMELMNI